MVLYDVVAKEVAPKKAKLATAEKQYEDTMAFLNDKRRMLAELNAKLARLNEKLQVTLAKKIDLETQVIFSFYFNSKSSFIFLKFFI